MPVLVIHRKVQKDGTPDELRVFTPNELCDGNRHSVKVVCKRRTACFYLDWHTYCYTIPGKFSTLDINLHTFIAGIDKTAIKPSNKYIDIHQIPNYRGCLRGVRVNKTNILKAAINTKKYVKVHGSLNKSCSGQITRNVIGFNSDSYLRLGAPFTRALLLSFYFRTYHENGLLCYCQSAFFFKLILVYGRLNIQPYLLGPQRVPFKVGENLADGNWHFVRVRINRNGFTLSVDEDEISWKKPKRLRTANLLSFKTIIFGRVLGVKSFIGCLNELKVNNDRFTNTSIARYSRLQFGRCPIRNLCFPNPCRYEAKCTNKVNHFSCDCSGLYYTGRLCTNPLYRSSCQEYAKLGLKRDAVCSLLPDRNISSMPFQVLCSMLGSRTSIAVMDNDKKSWQKVEKHSSQAVGDRYVIYIHYSLNLRNIKAVMSGSRRCYQYVAVNWTHVVLNVSGNNQPVAQWLPYSWKSSNAVPIITHGYIRDKSKLPVTGILFHRDAVGSYYHVGPLKCIGTKRHSQPLPASVNSHAFLKNVCNPLILTSDNNRTKEDDSTMVDSGFPSLKTEPSLKPESSLKSEEPATLRMKEEASVSNTEKVAVIKEPSEMSQFNTTEQKNGSCSSSIALSKMLTVILVLVAVGEDFLMLLIGFLCALRKRRMQENRESATRDNIGLQPERDLWMRINSCGYDVKTGKITYGHDIYRTL